MPQETDQLIEQLPSIDVSVDTTDTEIGPTVPRLEVQIVNLTTEVDNHERRIASIEAEIASGNLSHEDHVEAEEDLQFARERIEVLQDSLSDLIAQRSGVTTESFIEAPIGQSPANIEALTDEAEAIAALANIPEPKE